MFQRQTLKCAEDLWKASQGHFCAFIQRGKMSAKKNKKKVLNYS